MFRIQRPRAAHALYSDPKLYQLLPVTMTVVPRVTWQCAATSPGNVGPGIHECPGVNISVVA